MTDNYFIHRTIEKREIPVVIERRRKRWDMTISGYLYRLADHQEPEDGWTCEGQVPVLTPDARIIDIQVIPHNGKVIVLAASENVSIVQVGFFYNGDFMGSHITTLSKLAAVDEFNRQYCSQCRNSLDIYGKKERGWIGN